ncbi:MAG: aconitase X catalytic domain-containing protein [Candidatus Altiarchaeota archaeon]|nr:aconitase X catalytic domain-containing protein [Candidatus Altiarchaeota archaeon]
MDLTKQEQLMLNGEEGDGVEKAMEILVALGEIYDARGMIEIESAQVSGVSYKNLGDAGLEFLTDWAEKNARVRVKTTLNPAGVDIENWRVLGISEEFTNKQRMVLDAYTRMGVIPSCTCTPYLIGNLPRFRDHISWSESSAVSYANSVLGARTNREAGVSALAAAVTGRTPCYGYHLDVNRKADFVVEVEWCMNGFSDYGALGYMVGKEIGNSVPYFKFKRNEVISRDELKTLGASMAASGAVALYHVHGVTPEAEGGDVIGDEVEKIIIEDLDEGYSALNSTVSEIDFVAVGCPHASVDELKKISALLRNRRVKAELWITTARETKKRAEKLVKEIEECGAHVVSDTCMIVAPIEELGFRNMATNAGKAAFYAPSHCGLNVRFGSLEECIKAAINKRWPTEDV